MAKKILAGVFIIFIILQFFQPTLPEVTDENPNDLLFVNPEISNEVAALLRNSCYDCHSNETVYPWYSKISPVSLLLVRDIEEGRKELNFSNWNDLSKMDQAALLGDIQDVVSEGEMPMQIYTLIHQDATLSDSQIELLVNWTDEFTEQIFE